MKMLSRSFLSFMLALSSHISYAYDKTVDSGEFIKFDEIAANQGFVDEAGSAIADSLFLDDRSELRFLREKSGDTQRIGILLLSQSARTRALVEYLSSVYRHTPLELFVALAPVDSKPSKDLVDDHRRLAKLHTEISDEPRKIDVEAVERLIDHSGSQSIDLDIVQTPSYKSGIEYELCVENGHDYHILFLNETNWQFSGDSPPSHGHGHDLASDHYGVTGVSSKRSLGVCNAGGYVKRVRVEQQVGENLWFQVPGGSAWILPGTSLFYYSDSWPMVSRYRVSVSYTSVVPGFNIAHTEGSW